MLELDHEQNYQFTITFTETYCIIHIIMASGYFLLRAGTFYTTGPRPMSTVIV